MFGYSCNFGKYSHFLLVISTNPLCQTIHIKIKQFLFYHMCWVKVNSLHCKTKQKKDPWHNWYPHQALSTRSPLSINPKAAKLRARSVGMFLILTLPLMNETNMSIIAWIVTIVIQRVCHRRVKHKLQIAQLFWSVIFVRRIFNIWQVSFVNAILTDVWTSWSQRCVFEIITCFLIPPAPYNLPGPYSLFEYRSVTIQHSATQSTKSPIVRYAIRLYHAWSVPQGILLKASQLIFYRHNITLYDLLLATHTWKSKEKLWRIFVTKNMLVSGGIWTFHVRFVTHKCACISWKVFHLWTTLYNI